MRHGTAAVALILAVAAVGVMALWAGDEAPRAIRSTGGMEGLTKVAFEGSIGIRARKQAP